MATTEKVSVLAANLDAALKADLREITATQFTRKQYVFPMSEDEFNASFPATISVFSDRAPATNGGTVTNMVIANQVSCPFLLTGVSVTLIPDTIRAAIDGMVTNPAQAGFVALTPGATPAWDRISATAGNPVIGANDLPVPNTGSQSAVFKWGSCSQDFAQAFAQAYNLRFLLGCKWEVFDEPLASMVCFDGQAGLTDGSGLSQIDMAAAIRKANDRAIDVLKINPFFPRTIEQSPALAAQPVARAVDAPAPTAPENVGSVTWQNQTGGFFALDLPILLTPYTTIMMELHNNAGDLVYYPRMKQEATAQDSEVVLYPGANGSLTDGAGTARYSLRKYGTLSIMTTLHGFNLESAAVSDYANLVASGGFSQYLTMYSGDQLLGPQIAAANASRALEGVAGAKRLAGGPR